MEDKIIVIQECSAGNSEAGSVWYETKIFNGENTLNDVIFWKNLLPGCHGRTVITIENKKEIPYVPCESSK